VRFHAIALVVSYLLFLFAAAFVGPILAAAALGEDGVATFATYALPAFLTFAMAYALRFYSKDAEEELRDREAFASVGFTWIAISLLASLPFLIRGTLTNPVDAFFESMSGFTTTGASVITNLDDRAAVPGSIVLWRAEMQWLGGMGIVVLSIVVLSRVLGGGVSLMRAEITTHQVTRLRPRIAQTAGLLWGVYVLYTAAQVVLLLAAGMSPLDAVCHSFSTISTGGFGTRGLSYADPAFYSRPAVDVITMVFMVIGGISFTLHYNVLVHRKWRALVKDPEVRMFVATVVAASFLIAASLVASGLLDAASAVRQAFFNVISITSSTGFANADTNLWPVPAQFIILTLTLTGACSGSTSGALKMARILVILQATRREVMRVVHPRAIVPVRLGGRIIPEEMVNSVITFFAIYLMIFAGGALSLTAMGIGAFEAMSASATCLGNVGPGFGTVGSLGSYSSYPDGAKLVLAMLMWLGRLEIFAGLVVLFPASYKK
jgi:trk system potassium uptake protein TrkH